MTILTIIFTQIMEDIAYLLNDCGIIFFKIIDKCLNIHEKIIISEKEQNHKESNKQITKNHDSFNPIFYSKH